MDLARLGHADLSTWRAPLGLAALLVLVQWSGTVLSGTTLRYDREAIVTGGEWYRLVSGHLYHYDATHLGWNLAGVALVAWLFVREYTLGQWLVILVVSTVAVDVGFLVFEPQLAWYVGFSGVLHGLAAAGLVRWWVRYRDAMTLVASAVFAGKLGWEHTVGPLPFTAETLAIPVVHAAHTYGAVGGAVTAWLLGLRQPRPAPSL
jgi:rhomboid family GlyGly-CTERM serine protease